MNINRGIIHTAKKVLIYGPEGIGKSTLASRFPEPVFIDTEGSTRQLDVARFDAPTSWAMLHEQIKYVVNNPTCCKTLVIDTADWAEKLCIEDVLAQRKLNSIEDAGYGKGYVYVKEAFGKMLNLLGDVIDKGINVVITAHAMMRKFEQPDELGAYDRWELKLSKQTSPLVKEWADMVLFCNYKTMVINVDNQGAQKGKNKAQGGKRVMYTTHHACWDAKNRFGLPDELPMDYEPLRSIIETSQPAAAPAPAPAPAPKAKDPEPAPVEDTVRAEPKPEAPAPAEPKPEPKKEETVKPPDQAPEGFVQSSFFSDPEKIPKNLRDLMDARGFTEWDIQNAVHVKGYYPDSTLIQDMDPEFVQGWIVAFWPQVCDLIEKIKKGIPVEF